MSKRLLKGSTTSDPNKLTRAQQNLLAGLSRSRMDVADYYKPGRLLVDKGLAARDAFGLMVITEAGREWLKKESEAGK